MIVLAAITRNSVADYVSAVFFVYIVLIFAHILLSMLFSFGMRVPYARWTDAVIGFLRDIVEPYLRVFRRVLPSMGAFDLSPLVGIIALYIVRAVIVGLIR